MKKSILIAVLAATTIFTTSCSKDDAPAPITIESTLTTSKQAYKDANDGNWIEVTKEEYDNLAKELEEITKVGLNDTDYESDDTKLRSGARSYTLAMTGGTSVRIPKDAYTIAFKYVSKEAGTRVDDKVKISSNSDPLVGYTNLGTKLPSHSGVGEHYFVIKNNSTKNTAEGHLAFYSSKNTGYKTIAGISNRVSNGDSNTLNSTETIIYQFQALATIKKQW